jgi:hypothetical protein
VAFACCGLIDAVILRIKLAAFATYISKLRQFFLS